MKTNSDERKLLLSKINDIINICQKRNSVCESGFLDPAEVIYVKRNVFFPGDPKCVFYGGYKDAERCVFAAMPQWEDESGCAVSCIKINITGKEKLTHRDYLGSVLALGIERGVIGDILVKDSSALLFCKSEISDFIVLNLTKIARTGVVCEKFFGDIKEYTEKRCKEASVNVSSLRLDAFISASYNISRTIASQLIEGKNVKRNYEICTKSDAKIDENDLISVRGYGRIRFVKIAGKSRKDRFYLDVLKYV